ncbi:MULTISPECIES: hypothetical protein [Pseudomonas]|uniref:hypothetical protein n=1 Tax=Pseudomonas TaxID=286 RepID=UPI0009319B47|nr:MULTISPECIES: hypothetical protein [Pseudomonas]
MMGLRGVLVVSALYVSTVCSAQEPNTALKDDLSLAKSNQALAQELWVKNRDACMTRDTSVLAEVMRSANKQLHAQKALAASAYPGCRQMLSDVLFINGGCYTGKLSQGELDRSRTNWEKDSAACSTQIENPSASSADSEVQSEAEWEAQQRREGASEDDIKTMKAIRAL